MRKSLLIVLLFALAAVVTGYVSLYPTGAPPGYTGSPGDGQNCTACHGGTATTSSGWITSNIPPTGYVPGQTYQITATNNLTGGGKYGFEVSPQDLAGNLLGTLSPGSNNQLVGNGKYVTHISANITNNTWTFNWTAPAAGTGTVTFYGAFAKGKPGPVILSTLVVDEALSPPGSCGPISGPTLVCQGNTATYSISPVPGATSYTWGVPAGSTIVSGQGNTSIQVFFGISSTSGNITVYASNSAGNGPTSSLAVTVSSAPTTAGTITGNSSPCEGSQTNYSVPQVSGYSYTWLVPQGWVITGGQGTSTISVTVGTSSGDIQVTASNNCGTSPASSLPVNPLLLPAAPITPQGPDLVNVALTPETSYTIDPVANATDYQWELLPVEAGVLSFNGTQATIQWSITNGTASLKARATNACGNGPWSNELLITVFNTTGISTSDMGLPLLMGDINGKAHKVIIPQSWSPVRIKIVTLTGQVIFLKEFYDKVFEIPAVNSGGLFLLEVSSNEHNWTRKIIL